MLDRTARQVVSLQLYRRGQGYLRTSLNITRNFAIYIGNVVLTASSNLRGRGRLNISLVGKKQERNL